MDRRTFIKTTSSAGIGMGFMAKHGLLSRPRVPSDKVVVGVMGVNSRGHVLSEAFAQTEGSEVAYVCDVDSRALAITINATAELQARKPQGVIDLRRMLDDPDLDAVVIAAPDHWHAPAAIMALQAGKHVYLEKPCSHNPREGELLVTAQEKYNRIVQLGTQRRSSAPTINIIQHIREGIIGRPYFARAWYANRRETIGHGQAVPVPDWLDYELWQGPAPRTPYRNNVVHYNWHWFKRWGTGEICNNGTHMVDLCRWALQVDFPVRVTSSGGRYHHQDDWEFPDTQVACFDFEKGKTISWESRSRNGYPLDGRSVGVSIHGTDGTVLIDGDGYTVLDAQNNEIVQHMESGRASPLDRRAADNLTDRHIENFLAAVRGDVQPNAPINEGRKSVLLCHLGNIAQYTGRTLHCDPSSGHILNDNEAISYWSRVYEPGWEPAV